MRKETTKLLYEQIETRSIKCVVLREWHKVEEVSSRVIEGLKYDGSTRRTRIYDFSCIVGGWERGVGVGVPVSLREPDHKRKPTGNVKSVRTIKVLLGPKDKTGSSLNVEKVVPDVEVVTLLSCPFKRVYP